MTTPGDTPTTMADLPGSGLLRSPGRRSTITDELIESCAQQAAAGAFIVTIASNHDVHEKTFHDWLATGRELDAKVADILADPDLTEDQQEDALWAIEQDCTEHALLCLRLYREVTKATARGELRLVVGWVEAGRKDWRAAEAFLRRRFPDRWAEHANLHLSGPGGGPIRTEDVAMRDLAERIASDPELAEAADAFLAAAAGSAPSIGPDITAAAADEPDDPGPDPGSDTPGD